MDHIKPSYMVRPKIIRSMDTKKFDLSMVRFFNSYDLSDCTLEIIEEGPGDEVKNEKASMLSSVLIKTESENHSSGEVFSNNNQLDEKLVDASNGLSHSPSKKQKLDSLFSAASDEEITKNNKTVLYIHSLLFCSNSEYFQKLLMSQSRQQNVRMYLKPGETSYFIKLIKLFYDDSQIVNMPLIDTVYVLKFAKRFTCINLTTKLLDHISTCKISSVSTLNQSIQIFYDLLELECDNMHELIIRMKSSCLKYLKSNFCPVEKIFGPLLYDFMKLSYDSLYFFLDNVDAGMAVTEDNVIAFVMHWIVGTNLYTTEKKSALAVKLLNKCRVEYSSTPFIMDVLSNPDSIISTSIDYHEYYVKSLEYLITPEPSIFFPDHQKRANRTRNFALDHEVLLFFAPEKVVGGEDENPTTTDDEKMLTSLSTEQPNVIFVRGYELGLTAGVFQTEKDKELRVQFTVNNVNRFPHSKLYFSMLYAVNSPSVSEFFSPWNHCTIAVDSSEKTSWVMVSLIAEHSLIKETGFYLKFYIE